MVGPDLLLRVVHLGFLLGLPELVHPSQRVGRTENGGRQTLNQLLQLQPVLSGELDLERRMIRAEHLGQHPMGIARGERPPVQPLLLSQLLALFQRDCDAGVRLDEEMVFREKTSEQHAVPVLVGALMHQVIDPLASRACVAPISELSPMGAQAVAQSTLLRIHVSIGFTLMYSERFQRGEGAGLRYISRAYDGPLKLIPQIS